MTNGTIHEKTNDLLDTTRGEIEELQAEYDRINEQYKAFGAQRDSLGDVLRNLKYLAGDLEAYLKRCDVK